MIEKILDKFYRILKKANLSTQCKKLKYIGKNVVVKEDVMFIHPSKISIDDYTMIGERCYIRGG